ncbi:MAG: type I polyketide synthase, partial [Phaeodactylibacter sp.]|nr:type I polyketide synthase [Phaeodactylibacter sp.]
MGDGVATVVLKRAADALRDKDHIYALIKGTAVNNDGANKQGYTTPSVDCQRDVILEALALAAIDPITIGLLEAHGTGTLIGDPIEVAALTEAYRKYTGKQQYCALGSVKSNIGHLDAAAGIASLIKAVLCVKEGRLVPSINFSEANPVLELEHSPFYVSREDRPWPAEFSVRRAGVSSLGVGGTNVHVLLEEPPTPEASSRPGGPSIIALSAATAASLEAQKAQWAAAISDQSIAALPDLEFTSLYGRKAMPFRFCSVAGDTAQLVAQLRGENLEHTFSGTALDRAETFFLFPGQGSQYPDMAAGLYRMDPAFQSDMDRCFDFLKSSFNLQLKPILFEHSNGLLHQTENTQAALFAVEYSLAQVLIRAGFRPQALIGHSIGEYVAACIAGCMDLEAALTLVYHRGRLMGSMPKGSMLLIRQQEEAIRPLLLDQVSVCVYNADDNIVLGGSPEAIEQQKAVLELNNIEFRPLRVSHAYHTEMMQAVLPEFREVLAGIDF